MFRNTALVTVSILALFVSSQRGMAQSQDQSVPNLSGTWELIEDDNDAMKLKPTHAGFPRLKLVISQEGSLIRFTQKQIRRGAETVQEYSYYTDGRSETNVGRVELWPHSVARFESVSGWQKERLLIKYNAEHLRWIGRSVSDTWVTRKDEWRLGSNGETLIVTISTVRNESGGLYVGATDQSQTVTRAGGLEKRRLTFRKI